MEVGLDDNDEDADEDGDNNEDNDEDRDVLPIAKGRDDPGTAKPIVRKARYPMTPGSNHVEIAGSDPHSHVIFGMASVRQYWHDSVFELEV